MSSGRSGSSVRGDTRGPKRMCIVGRGGARNVVPTVQAIRPRITKPADKLTM
jgi:hypothetical protein